MQTKRNDRLIDASAFVAPGATVIGDVTLAEQTSVWFGAVVRGDTESIHIGARTNVQDLSVLHADPGFPLIIGRGVTVGHAAVVHGATIGDDTMVGIRAVVLNGAKIGAGCLVGAGCVVTEGMMVPDGQLVLGVPARIVRPVSSEHRTRIIEAAQHYVHAADIYRKSLA
jgi:carbonic anhydrase/acetyltransferase-like protein (isoleucine patch superfamily)